VRRLVLRIQRLVCSSKPGKLYGPQFPQTTIRDDVRIHKQVLESLGVKEVMFAIGGSMGGMQVLEWAFYPFVKNFIPIATSGRHSAWCISWGEAQRQSIYSDPKYNDGHYDEFNPPFSGLSAARMAALLTYRSRNSFESRFGRRAAPKKTVEKQSSDAELYHNEGNKFRMHEEKNRLKVDTVEPVKTPPKPAELIKTQSDASDDSKKKEFTVFSAQSYLRYQGDKFIHRYTHLTPALTQIATSQSHEN
jgi:homoserine O-acetyltransferase/O-succinyltransferase